MFGNAVVTFAISLLLFSGRGTCSANAVASHGLTSHDTTDFTLELDNANQVATRLIARPGPNAGSADFNFLLPTVNRTDDKNYYLGDIQLRLRASGTTTWTDLSSHYARQPIAAVPVSGNTLAGADLTSSLGTNLPIKVVRTWSKDGDSVVMSFNITNVSPNPVEFGGVGIPLPYNDNWIGKDQQATWTESAVSDPATCLDAGYVLTNRLTGEAPTLLTVPVGKTPLEQYRLNLPDPSTYPDKWMDAAPLDYNYEGIFSWWAATGGLLELDNAAATAQSFDRGGDYNTPTSFTLAAGSSRTFSLRFYTASGPRTVEDRLPAHGRPVVVGVPGFVAAQGELVKLLIRSTSAPSIDNVTPPIISFGAATQVSNGLYSFTGQISTNGYGSARVMYKFANGDVGSAHYTVIKTHQAQLDDLGTFRFDKQYFTDSKDFFHRGPGIISYDHKKGAQVVDENRAWIAGMSDEAGTGAYVSAAAKQFGRPDAAQVSKLEQFANTTIFGHLQVSTPGANYGGVRKSLFYYDAALNGKQYNYDPSVDHSGTWDRTEAENLARSYNYPHPLIVYWTLYRLARNHVGLTSLSWDWYLDRAYDTIIGMKNLAGIDNGYASFGLMEGTYFLEVLRDLQREGETDKKYATRATDVETFMKQRADLWNGEAYPYASEFAWDNTGQEEVYAWTNYFGYSAKAKATVETLMAVMSSVPHWGYSGTGRDLWDFMFSAQSGPGARLERCLHHYKGAQSALPLLDNFQANPTDIKMLRAGYGGVIGPLASIGEDGFGSTGFHSRPDYLGWDPLSGDNGVNMALYTLSARAVVVNDASVGGWAGFGAAVSTKGSLVSITPQDGLRKRLFIAPIALYVELDAGQIASATYDSNSHAVTLQLEAADQHTQNARLRLITTAKTPDSAKYDVQGNFATERQARVVPLSQGVKSLSLTRS